MSLAPSCPVCGCCSAAGVMTHAIAAALADDDLDRAIESGLLGSNGCTDCSAACTSALIVQRDARLDALAARERYRQRNARLQRRAAERAARRAPPPAIDTPAEAAAPIRPALPSAAAAALARAKAKAAERHKP